MEVVVLSAQWQYLKKGCTVERAGIPSTLSKIRNRKGYYQHKEKFIESPLGRRDMSLERIVLIGRQEGFHRRDRRQR
jgi:hypothetical protein